MKTWCKARRRKSLGVRASPTVIAAKAALRAQIRQRERARQQREQDNPDRQRAIESLLGFCQWTYPGYRRADFLELVAGELEAIERGENDRLIVQLPPRHSKTETVSIRFPAWVLCRNPTWPIIAASYGDLLANETGRRVRNIVDTQGLFPDVQLASDSQAKNLWHTKQGGQFLSVGIGSGVIGFGGRLITIDDPFKKREEAESEVQRDKIWNWYTSEILTRQEPGAAVVVVMHRWHEDDLAGRLLLSEAKRWRVVRLPALAEDRDTIGRNPGQALWPWRYDEEALATRRQEIGERDWNSLYQQRPAPAEGAIFKWFPTYETYPKLRQIVIGIDTAYSEAEQADYTAWAVWGFDGSRAYLLEADRFQGEVPEAERHLTAAFWRVKQQHANVPVKGLVRNRVAIDRVAAQHLRRGVSIEVLPRQDPNGWPVLSERPVSRPSRAGLPVTEVKLPAGNTKAEMGSLVSVEFEGGRALVPTSGLWLEPWMEEHKTFPYGSHDDWVETTVVVLRYLFRSGTRTPLTEPVQVYGDY